MTTDSQEALLYKEDLFEAKKRLRAFWEHEIIDRVCLGVFAPKEKQVPLPQPANETEYLITWQANTNPNYVVRLYNAVMSNTYYGGEALPVANAPGNLLYAAYGGNARFTSGTVWVDPGIYSCEDWENYCFNPENRFIKDTLRITRALAEDAPGKYLVGSPGVFGPLDAMSTMRGVTDFVMELALPECADSIRKAHQKVMKGFKYISEEIYKISNTGQDGCVVFPWLWAPARINFWSADFSYVLGPKHFQQWLLPEMQELAEFLEFNMYHLDGPDAAATHLPMILEIDEIQGIQYSPGEGHDSLAEALPVYKHIQQGGKVQFICCAYDEVEIALRELDPRGLLIWTWAPNIEAAEALLKNAERWSIKEKSFARQPVRLTNLYRRSQNSDRRGFQSWIGEVF